MRSNLITYALTALVGFTVATTPLNISKSASKRMLPLVVRGATGPTTSLNTRGTLPTCKKNERHDSSDPSDPRCFTGANGQCCPKYGPDSFCFSGKCLQTLPNTHPTYKDCGECPHRGQIASSTGQCICPSGQTLYASGCGVTCHSPQVYNPSKRCCETPVVCTASQNKVNGKCVDKCPEQQTYDTTTCKCICPKGMRVVGKTCQNICGPKQTYNPQSNSCTCPAGQVVQGSTCVAQCSSPQSYNSSTKKCSCPAGYTVKGSGCQSNCASDETYKNGSCQCTNSSQFMFQGHCASKPTCSAPQTQYNSSTNTCGCPSATTLSPDGRSCNGPPPPKCTAPQVKQNGKCAACPAGTAYSSNNGGSCLTVSGGPCKASSNQASLITIIADPSCTLGLCIWVPLLSIFEAGGYQCK